MLIDALLGKGLTRREAEVATLVSKGLPNKEVGLRLFVEEKTVKFHLTNIYRKMAIKSRAQLIVWCMPHVGFEEKKMASQAIEAPEVEKIGNSWQLPSGPTKIGNA